MGSSLWINFMEKLVDCTEFNISNEVDSNFDSCVSCENDWPDNSYENLPQYHESVNDNQFVYIDSVFATLKYNQGATLYFFIEASDTNTVRF